MAKEFSLKIKPIGEMFVGSVKFKKPLDEDKIAEFQDEMEYELRKLGADEESIQGMLEVVKVCGTNSKVKLPICASNEQSFELMKDLFKKVAKSLNGELDD